MKAGTVERILREEKRTGREHVAVMGKEGRASVVEKKVNLVQPYAYIFGENVDKVLQEHKLGVTTFRQIAHWSESDIDEFDAKLHEFPGRIRRDGWVTQARELHQSKYGETLPPRGR